MYRVCSPAIKTHIRSCTDQLLHHTQRKDELSTNTVNLLSVPCQLYKSLVILNSVDAQRKRSVAGWCMSTFVNTRFASFVFVYVAQSTISRSLCPLQIFQRRSSDMRPHSALLEGKRCAAHLRPINAPSSWLCNHSWCSRASEG